MSKSKTVNEALPCGNPKRYTSAEVVQMQRNDKKSPHLSSASTSENQSESDRYITTLVKRQIHTDVTLNQQFSQHRKFTECSSHAPSVTQLQGLHSVHEHAKLDEYDSTIEYLKSCGLTNREIAFKLKGQIPKTTEARGYGADPVLEEQIVTEIERKLIEKEEALRKPDKFNGGLELSRHALVLEKAILEQQNKESELPQFLFKEKRVVSDHPDDPINHIPAILSHIEANPCRETRRERRRKRKLDQKLLRQQKYLGVETNPKAHHQFMQSVGLIPESPAHDIDTPLNSDEDLSNSSDRKTFDKGNHESKDGSIYHSNNVSDNDEDDDKNNREADVDGATIAKKKKKRRNAQTKGSGTFTMKDIGIDVTLVRDEDIQSNRLSLQEILTMEKFQHYEQGNPSKAVFVKNLPNNVTEVDLISLFGRFEQHNVNASSISFRLLSGRMKGQAFVTFPDVETARHAIANLNGYKLRGRPMILSFGKKQIDLPCNNTLEDK